MKYEIFEHTADIGIKIFGRSYEEIFNNSVESFSEVMIDTTGLTEAKKREVSLRSTTPDFLLVDLLSLILADFEAEGILYHRSDLIYDPEKVELKGQLFGSSVGEIVEYRNVIKAVTYHKLELFPEKGYAKVVFDI